MREEAAELADALCGLVDKRLSAKQSCIVNEAVSAAASVRSEHWGELIASVKQMQDEHHAAIAEMKAAQQATLADLKAQHAAAVADMAERWDAQETAILTELQLLRDELKTQEAKHRDVLEQQSSPNPSSKNRLHPTHSSQRHSSNSTTPPTQHHPRNSSCRH
ncbi:uncharacterized protein IUM83_07466 [Phytophthora cinnamomi]|uniref:uncharacterized protein n=1 Tax=Phytophthora cinnamomi TaxID=4785 RepID=UPI0035595A3E|nr:hypothetical protein IUM83_07466 [Phytophthora cinnamomi]